MAIAAIKQRIADVIQAADPAAKVWPRLRYLNVESQIDQIKGSDGALHVWFVWRESTALRDIAVNQNLTEQMDTVIAEAFYGVNDENDSDAAFEAAVDAVLQALNADRRAGPGGTELGGLVKTAYAPVRRSTDFQMYGPSQALCHHAQISMRIVPVYLQ
jgi:hypothetical protein